MWPYCVCVCMCVLNCRFTTLKTINGECVKVWAKNIPRMAGAITKHGNHMTGKNADAIKRQSDRRSQLIWSTPFETWWDDSQQVHVQVEPLRLFCHCKTTGTIHAPKSSRYIYNWPFFCRPVWWTTSSQLFFSPSIKGLWESSSPVSEQLQKQHSIKGWRQTLVGSNQKLIVGY